ncbi:hypothetical protein [Gimesia maris]|uniref:Uncharacterized protein n=1 Tax=Gimesia maris TaxID=122 RepID=A0ABX5YPM1_9PLAN|nr:hypothetical protein [Gimesia maris]QEG17540.1 hypothetical protein GmarT_34220 [Gimesia maris]QGQ29396.1 hypothetical protein F1729_12410 [Gimesia maris]
MKRNAPQSQPVSPVIRLFTILLCFAAGGFCLFMSGIGQSVEPPAVAASSPAKTAQTPSPTREFKLKSVADFCLFPGLAAPTGCLRGPLM